MRIQLQVHVCMLSVWVAHTQCVCRDYKKIWKQPSHYFSSEINSTKRYKFHCNLCSNFCLIYNKEKTLEVLQEREGTT